MYYPPIKLDLVRRVEIDETLGEIDGLLYLSTIDALLITMFKYGDVTRGSIVSSNVIKDWSNFGEVTSLVEPEAITIKGVTEIKLQDNDNYGNVLVSASYDSSMDRERDFFAKLTCAKHENNNIECEVSPIYVSSKIRDQIKYNTIFNLWFYKDKNGVVDGLIANDGKLLYLK